MRLFIALELPPEAVQAADRIAKELKASGADVKWVKPEAMHLTLKFLGETPEGQVADISEALGGACQGRQSLALSLKGCGAFPSPQKPQVVWLGLDGQTSALTDLAREMEERLELLGFPPERRSFKAHLTLGRLRRGPRGGGKRGGSAAPLARALAVRADYQGPDFRAGKVVLLQSTLTPAGPIYKPLAEFELA